MRPKNIAGPTAKSLAGEMKNNKVFGTNMTPPKGKSYPSIKKVMPKKIGAKPMKKAMPKKTGKQPTFAQVQKSVAKTMGHK